MKQSIFAVLIIHIFAVAMAGQNTSADDPGKDIYDYYCYQCHAYSGDARTLAATFVSPPPRNFQAADPCELTRERMQDAVRSGREGTAMVAFDRVLDEGQIQAVVSYIRTTFMSDQPFSAAYHTEANGWPDHDRYRQAFPFATGEIALDTAWEQLSDNQRAGRKLFMKACISCHDWGRVERPGPNWRSSAFSYPRTVYSHRDYQWDAETSATPYYLHDRSPDAGELSVTETSGMALFLVNCAFCHAADGTGRNWIGSFLEPGPADLTGQRVAGFSNDELFTAIANGVDGSTMPAWRNILNDEEINDLIAYLAKAIIGSSATGDNPAGPRQREPQAPDPSWVQDQLDQ